MSNAGFRHLALAAAVLGAICAGCSKTEEQQKAEQKARLASMTPVTEKQAGAAKARVEDAWKQVRDKVQAAYGPSKDDLTFYLDLAVLTRHPHRLAGYGGGLQSRQTATEASAGEADAPGSIFAANYVANRLMAMGFQYVETQDFPVVQPVTIQCELLVDGKSYTIEAARPNILQAPVTPAEGIVGQTVYVGKGEVASYGNNFVKDKIVVLDFNCQDNWLNAFAFGARAVLFVEGDEPASKAYHHINMPANLPRFYAPKDLAARLDLTGKQQEVKILAACEWREMKGRNVITVVRGTDPKFAADRPDQAIVLAAPLDSLSEVPTLSPGARDAANCAALLAIAEHMKNNPPKRDIIICFFDAQAENHLGAMAFYGSLYRRMAGRELADKTIEERLVRLDEERRYRQQMKDIVDRIAPLAECQGQLAKLAGRKADLAAEKEDMLAKQASGQAAGAAGRLAAIDAEAAEVDGKIAEMDAKAASPEMAQIALFSPETRQMPRHSNAVRFLREEAKNFDSDILDKLRPMRVDNKDLGSGRGTTERRIAATNQNIAELEAQAASLEAELKGQPEGAQQHAQKAQELESLKLQAARGRQDLEKLSKQRLLEERDMGWNYVIRDLFKEKLTDGTRARFARLVVEARKVLANRLGELDDLTARADKDLVLRNSFGPDRNDIVLHVSVNLGDARSAWTFIHGDSSAPQNDDRTGNYSAVFRVMRNIYKASSETAANFDARAVSESYDNRLFCPALYTDSSATASVLAIHNLSAMTVLDGLARQGLPNDTLGALDAGKLRAQAAELAPFLREMANHASLNLTPQFRTPALYTESDWSSNKPTGPSVKQAGAGSAMPDRPVRDAIVAIMRYSSSGPWVPGDLRETPPGFVVPIVLKTNTNGVFEVAPYSSHKNNYQSPRTFAASFDMTAVGNDEIPDTYATRGLIDSVVDSATLATESGQLGSKAIHLFKTRCKTLVGFGYDRGSIQTVTMRAQSTAKFRNDRHLLCELGNVLTLYASYEEEGMKVFCKTGAVLLNNEPTKDEHKGKGVSLADPYEHPIVVEGSARDLLMLNSYRLKLLRNSRINHESLERLNGEAADLRADAEGRMVRGDDGQSVVSLKSPWAQLAGDLGASAAVSRRAYNPLKGVMNDLITAVVLLLLLAMPFAYALERLIIGSPHIYRQITWFALFFLATFAVLYMVNPAFQIAATPIIIFLAFTIILLSTLVIFILVRKLQTEIKKMQGLGTTVHSADVSRLSTMSAAINMGISTMRRRPVRTLLTAVTVVLLTFTILTFASFGSTWGIRQSYQGPVIGSPYRVLVRHQLWSPISEGVLDTLKGRFTGQADVVGRYWVAPTAQQAKEIQEATRNSMDFMVASADLSRISPLSAAVGLDVRDVEKQPNLKALFSEENRQGAPRPLAMLNLLEDGVILTDAMRSYLGLKESDIGKARPIVNGLALVYAGSVSDKLGSFTLLDGSSMLPVDYQASAGTSVGTFAEESSTQSLSEMPDVESAQFVYFNIDQVVIVSPKTAKLMGGRVRAITIYPYDDEKVASIGQAAAKSSELPAYAGDRSGVTRMIFTSLAEASGARDLLVPVLLGGMIIFATMLGSVSDREREIYTFSSLGLAPAHVASLFFAEASIYAVVGGMGGYLLGQVVARVLGFLASLGWMSVPTMNYSSTNAIVTVLIVMCTVLISTIYPAMKASRSANPGIQRSWRIPQPEGNLYDLMFPFTVSAYDIIGVVSFLKEHFDNYSDTSLGVFTSMRCWVFRQESNDMLGFRASVALAPFDLGVTQEFALLSQTSEIEGIDEVRILIYRLSGAQGDWRRSNRVFINELRKQLLIWRSLPQEVMDKYRNSTLDAWGELPVEQVDQDSFGGSA